MKKGIRAAAKAACILIGYLAIHYLCAWTLPLSASARTLIANVTALAAVAVVCHIRGRAPLKAVGLQCMPVRTWIVSVGAGVGACLLVRLMLIVVPFPDTWTQHYTTRVAVVQQAPPWLVLLSTVIVAPLAEEVLFRGCLYRMLTKGFPIWAAMLGSSAVFGLVHGSAMWMVYTFLLGLVFCYLYHHTHSLWSCVMCHIGFNAMGQIPLIGAMPYALIAAVFAGGAFVFVWALASVRSSTKS